MQAKFPPFARDLQPLDGWVWIYCGKRAWRVRERQKGGAQTCSIVYPADRPPKEYRWPVRGLICAVDGLDADLRDCAELVVTLIDAGAVGVWLIHDALEPKWVWYPTDVPHLAVA